MDATDLVAENKRLEKEVASLVSEDKRLRRCIGENHAEIIKRDKVIEELRHIRAAYREEVAELKAGSRTGVVMNDPQVVAARIAAAAEVLKLHVKAQRLGEPTESLTRLAREAGKLLEAQLTVAYMVQAPLGTDIEVDEEVVEQMAADTETCFKCKQELPESYQDLLPSPGQPFLCQECLLKLKGIEERMAAEERSKFKGEPRRGPEAIRQQARAEFGLDKPDVVTKFKNDWTGAGAIAMAVEHSKRVREWEESDRAGIEALVQQGKKRLIEKAAAEQVEKLKRVVANCPPLPPVDPGLPQIGDPYPGQPVAVAAVAEKPKMGPGGNCHHCGVGIDKWFGGYKQCERCYRERPTPTCVDCGQPALPVVAANGELAALFTNMEDGQRDVCQDCFCKRNPDVTERLAQPPGKSWRDQPPMI